MLQIASVGIIFVFLSICPEHHLGDPGDAQSMAKTQASLSDDPKKRNAPRGWRLQVRDVKVSNGAGFIVALTGKMMLMPGMPRESAVQKIDIDQNGRITGLS